jgi:hypothetical protein
MLQCFSGGFSSVAGKAAAAAAAQQSGACPALGLFRFIHQMMAYTTSCDDLFFINR